MVTRISGVAVPSSLSWPTPKDDPNVPCCVLREHKFFRIEIENVWIILTWRDAVSRFWKWAVIPSAAM